jgi:hypothetical protein
MNTSRLYLDKDELDGQLSKRGMNYADLARLIGWSRENLHYHVKNRTVMGAERSSAALRVDLKKLLKIERNGRGKNNSRR